MKPLRPNRRIFHMVTFLEVGGSEHQMVEVASRQSSERVSRYCRMLVVERVPLSRSSGAPGICVIEFNPKVWAFRPRTSFSYFG